MQTVVAYERALSNFRPLKRILSYDDFDNGANGWLDLKPNFVRENFAPHVSAMDHLSWGSPMLSTGTFRFPGTHGSMNGLYSMKLATRAAADRYEKPPAPGSMSHLIKRFARPEQLSKLQFEMWYTYTAEQDRPGIGETAVRAFGMYFDVQDSQKRYFPGVRYVNSVNGEMKQFWQYMKTVEVSDKEWAYGLEGDWCVTGIDPHWYGERFPDGSAVGFDPVPGGKQELIYNETDCKYNWMYLRLLVDLKRRKYLEFQSGDQVFDLSDYGPTLVAPYERIHNLINPIIFLEADTDRRVFLYVDSAVTSVE